MSTIQIEKERQPEPQKNLVVDLPVREGEKLYEHGLSKCIICSKPKIPYIFDQDKKPLVLRCTNCGHKSWANAASSC